MNAPHIAGRADTLVIGLVALAHLLSHFYQVVLGPLFPLLKEEFGVGYTELGLTISVLYGVSGVCQAFVGILVDRYGGYRLMIFGVVTMSTAVLLMGFAPAYWVLLPLAALAALGNKASSIRQTFRSSPRKCTQAALGGHSEFMDSVGPMRLLHLANYRLLRRDQRCGVADGVDRCRSDRPLGRLVDLALSFRSRNAASRPEFWRRTRR